MENINIAELLNDCPKGMELDCILFENPVKYESNTEDGNYPISIRTEEGELFYLTEEGYIYDRVNAKCVIYPKGKTTWEEFHRPFRDGDIIANNAYIAIFHKCGKPDSCISNHVVYYHCWYNKKYKDSKFKKDYGIGRDCEYRFATEEEKEKLFQAIKELGYKWNAETKTLEKLIVQKFKVGDKVKDKNNRVWFIVQVSEKHFDISSVPNAEGYFVPIEDQDDYELINGPKFKVGDKVRHRGNYNVVFTISSIKEDYYACGIAKAFWFADQDDYELVPNKFDISTLIPFESRVLVRDCNSHEWEGEIYTRYTNKSFDNCNFVTLCGRRWKQCIPYNDDTKHLLGTTNDCDEFYKTW